jgi:hypothetical protein
MKRVAVLFVLMAVLGVCSQSYGTIYIYNVSGMVKAVDASSNNVGRTLVRGFFVVDMNQTEGTVTDQSFVMFGRNSDGNAVYTEAQAVNVTLYGNVVAVVINVQGNGDEIILTSDNVRINNRNFGLAARNRVITMLDGSMHLNGGILFDTSASLVGTGDMTAILDTLQTKNANKNGEGVSNVVDDIITRLQARGFTQLLDYGGNEPPPE